MGLVDYSSSEEEEEEVQLTEGKTETAAATTTTASAVGREVKTGPPRPTVEDEETLPDAPPLDPNPDVPIGPSLGPAAYPPPGPSYPPPDSSLNSPLAPSSTSQTPPGSPHTLTRTTLHTLLFPTHMPTLPPSPDQKPSKPLTKKLEQYLDLKARGIHFNATLTTKISGPSAARELEAQIMQFAGVEWGGRYSVLEETWREGERTAAEGREWARGEELRRVLEGWERVKGRERERVGFVVGKRG